MSYEEHTISYQHRALNTENQVAAISHGFSDSGRNG
jgi:hypothetical protein